MGACLIDPAFGPEDVDTCVTSLQLASGAIATISNSRRALYGQDQRAEVFGACGMARLDNVYANQVHVHTSDGERRDNMLNDWMLRNETVRLIWHVHRPIRSRHTRSK
jgi:myo-inositol 2-dehydrogenase/D-chiro-inositol 1-dehydrogenase